MAALVQPARGMVLHLEDAQYRFGAGPIICRVIEVIDLLTLDGGPPWWHVRGECALGVRGHHGGWEVRELYVVSTSVHRPDRPKSGGGGG